MKLMIKLLSVIALIICIPGLLGCLVILGYIVKDLWENGGF